MSIPKIPPNCQSPLSLTTDLICDWYTTTDSSIIAQLQLRLEHDPSSSALLPSASISCNQQGAFSQPPKMTSIYDVFERSTCRNRPSAVYGTERQAGSAGSDSVLFMCKYAQRPIFSAFGGFSMSIQCVLFNFEKNRRAYSERFSMLPNLRYF